MSDLIVLRWPPGNRQAMARARAIRDDLLGSPQWEQRLERRGCLLLIKPTPNDVSSITLPHDMGVILGPLFRSDDHKRMTAIDADTLADWCASDAASLTGAYWGGYLAVLCDRERDRTLIVRDPMGARPCFHRLPDETGLHIVFTRFEDVRHLGAVEEVDSEFVSTFLLYPRLVTARTGLRNVREIRAGECIALHRTGLVEAWTPWRPPPTRPRERDGFDADAKDLAVIIRACVRAWSELGLPIMHRLSGGLDSSIVLAALQDCEEGQVRAGIDFPSNCPEGDERVAARAVAARFKVPLIEVEYQPTRIQYENLLDAPLNAKPSLADLSFADHGFADALGGADRLRLLSSGQGGDQIFYKADPMPSVADAVRDGLGFGDVIDVALDAARVARRSIYPALATGLAHCGPWARAYLRANLRARFGRHRGAKRAIAEIMSHPWLERGQCTRSGQSVRAMLLADVQYYHAPTVLSARALAAPMLVSQPIVEFCHALPLYHLQRGGVDRALARAAFADDLPALSVSRTEKGDTTRFHAEVARVNNGFLRDVLFDGELMREGLVGRDEVEAMVSTSPSAQAPRANVSAHLAAEIWLRKMRRHIASSQAARASAHCTRQPQAS